MVRKRTVWPLVLGGVIAGACWAWAGLSYNSASTWAVYGAIVGGLAALIACKALLEMTS